MAIGWMLGGALTAVGAYCLCKSGLKHQGIEDYLDEARARRWAREAESGWTARKARLASEAREIRERAAREAAEIKERIRREARAEQRRHSRQWAGHRNPEPEQERPGDAGGGRGTGGARKTPPRGSNDPFTVLGVDKAAIKTAYRRLAKGAHPDKNPGDPQAAERFRRIRKAYSEALKAAKTEPETRRCSDTSLALRCPLGSPALRVRRCRCVWRRGTGHLTSWCRSWCPVCLSGRMMSSLISVPGTVGW